MVNELVSVPHRCTATRAPRILERVRFFLLGRVRGFDPAEECRCNLYEGHDEFGYRHEDVTGSGWS